MDDNYTKIDQYLLGLLKENELVKFEQQMQNDHHFANQVEQQRKALQFLEIVKDNKMKANLKIIHNKVISDNKKELPAKTGWLRMALSGAAILLILLISYFVFYSDPDHQELFAENYQPYPISVSVRGQDVDQNLVQASKLYQEADYLSALTQFKRLEPRSDNTVIALGIALCELELNRPEKAILSFQKLLDDPLYQEPAQWYLALTYLKLEDTERCKTHLRAIKNSSEFYPLAKGLLNKLE